LQEPLMAHDDEFLTPNLLTSLLANLILFHAFSCSLDDLIVNCTLFVKFGW